MKLHIDTDIGSNIDDVCALALVLASDAELTGITTVAEHGGKRAGYAKYVLALAGRQRVDVAAGADVAAHGFRNRLPLLEESRYWPDPVSPAPGPLRAALDLLQRSIDADAVIVAIGPCTNLALLEQRMPGILRTARLVLMGGYVFPPRAGFPRADHTRDSNFQNDVTSALTVLRTAQPTLVPIPITLETALRRAHLAVLDRAGPVAALVAAQARAFAGDRNYEQRYGATCTALPDDTIAFLHDPLACAIALGWRDGVATQELRLDLDIADGWLHQTVGHTGSPATVVTRIDGAAFTDWWLTSVTQSGAT